VLETLDEYERRDGVRAAGDECVGLLEADCLLAAVWLLVLRDLVRERLCTWRRRASSCGEPNIRTKIGVQVT
jgi:hypothetical protein